jgi:hypothetical protein
MNFTALLRRFSRPTNRGLENSNPDRIRYSVYNPEGKKALTLFEKAVALMKERSDQNPGDPLGWTYQAGIHGIWNLDYDKPIPYPFNNRKQLATFAEEHGFDSKENVLNGNTVLNNCTHFTYLWNQDYKGRKAKINIQDASPANFIAWHRLYLQYFEEVARENLRLSGEADAETWALPYWAYLNEEDAVMPEIFRDPLSSLYTPYRNSQLNSGIPITDLSNLDPDYPPRPEDWSDLTYPALYQSTYLAMGTLIETMPHNAFHVTAGTDGELFDGNGLMFETSAAAFDPIFWVHHSFIDKLWSSYNASEHAFYAFQNFFDENPWNYMFITPSSNGGLEKERVSYWGDNSANVISKIYNPDYSYDYIGTVIDRQSDPGANKVLSIIQAPAFRPTIASTPWNERVQPVENQQELYETTIPLTVNSMPLTAGTYLNLTSTEPQNGNPFDFVSEIEFMLPEAPRYARFLLTTASNVDYILAQNQVRPGWGLHTQGMAMGHKGIAMPKKSIIDFGYSIIEPNGRLSQHGYSFVPSDSDPEDQLVILMITDSPRASVLSVTTSLNQNISLSPSDSSFDAAAYFAQHPNLLTNPTATADPEAYYEKHDRSRGIVAPEISFRAAATGMAYLMENNKLVREGISSSPYAAIKHYLNKGQKEGLSLGDSSLMTEGKYLRTSSQLGEGITLDFSSLMPKQKIVADLIIGGDSRRKSVVGFYHVLDEAGTVCVDGIISNPGDPDYARLATSNLNLFDGLTGLSANKGRAEFRRGIDVGRGTPMLAPFAVVNGQTFFGFAEANPDKINHFRIHANNILGLESALNGGRTDFDDLLIGFKFKSPVSSRLGQDSSSFPIMTGSHEMHV